MSPLSGCDSKPATISLLPGTAGEMGLHGDGGPAHVDSGAPGLGMPPAARVRPDGAILCGDDGDCTAPAPHCNVPTGACVACGTNDDCSTRLCNTTTFTCQRCIADTDCPSATPACDFDEGRCVECRTSDQCAPGQVCAFEAHACTTKCTTAADCSGLGRPICASASGVCVECTTNADCTEDSSLPFCDLLSGACVACLSSADCTAGFCDPDEHFCSG